MNKNMISADFRGNVSISQNGNIIYARQQGYADLANEIENQKNTRFASASAGKVFVSVGIQILIEKGMLNLSDTLGQLLTLDLNQIDPDVTVQELLIHTSGVPDYFDEEVMDEYESLWVDFPNYKIRKNADLLPLFIHKPMQYPKGSRFRYNNSGYVLLALIIEQLTQQPFDQYLSEVIFKPCNMDSTGYFELDRLPSRCANNYIFCEDTQAYRTNIYSVDAKGTGAGGAFITTADIERFWDALTHHRLLSKEMTKQMFSIHSQQDEKSCYGYGLWINKSDNSAVTTFNFQGYDPGVSFISSYDPENDLVITLVSNYGDNVWKEIRNIKETLSNQVR